MKSETCYSLCRAQCLIEAYRDSKDIDELENTRRWKKCPDYEYQVGLIDERIKELLSDSNRSN